MDPLARGFDATSETRDPDAERQVLEQTDGEKRQTQKRFGGQDFRRKWGGLGDLRAEFRLGFSCKFGLGAG